MLEWRLVRARGISKLFRIVNSKQTQPLPKRLSALIGRSFSHRVNCFCISEFFFRDTPFRHSTADEFINFAAKNFEQVESRNTPLLILVWSRSSFEIPIGEIKIKELVKRNLGFPFGLVLEHSFVQIDENLVFQKADPTTNSKVELTSYAKALAPYQNLKGFEITKLVPQSDF